MVSSELPRPTPELVLEYNARFDADPRYGVADRALAAVFAIFPGNVDLEHVVAKATLLNALYNTNVYAIVAMARHIHSLAVNRRLDAGDAALVEEISRLRTESGSRRHFAFATKYCSWHRPALFPIFDAIAVGVLSAYNRRYRFAQFSIPDLRTFSRYRDVVDAFRRDFGLADLTYKQIDKFLWYLGKQASL